MTLSVDLYFSFRSPYSYLALPKTLKLVAEYDVDVSLRAVYPLAVRVPDFFKRTARLTTNGMMMIPPAVITGSP